MYFPEEQSKHPYLLLARDTSNPPFINHKGNEVNSDWLANQWDKRSGLGHAQYHKGRRKGQRKHEIDNTQTPKCFDGRLALLEKIRKTSTDSIPNNYDFLEVDFCRFLFDGLDETKQTAEENFNVLKTMVFTHLFYCLRTEPLQDLLT